MYVKNEVGVLLPLFFYGDNPVRFWCEPALYSICRSRRSNL